jgi:phage terminase large subunit-like protein
VTSAFEEELLKTAELVLETGDVESRLKFYALQQALEWRRMARPEQIPPLGDWRTWYIQAGRGAGKTRAGAQWLAEAEAAHPPGEWAIIAPTMQDAVTTCVENALLPILGARVVGGGLGWKRSQGELRLRSGSIIYADGADDGALRMQGKNLKGAWCDEVGLWKLWDKAWNESIRLAVRLEPAQIVATGTPKMGHGLVRQLVESPAVIKTRMRTVDNVDNLHPAQIAELLASYKGTTRGKTELDGEWISAIEGDALKRSWWRYYAPSLLKPARNGRPEIGNGEIRFQWVIVSVDTPLKDKQASDNVAIQVWGVDHAFRYLLDAENRQMSYDQAKRSVKEKARWVKLNWRCQNRVLIENAGYGPDLAIELKREIGGVETVKANVLGNKGQRALAASGDLETGQCFLPGRGRADGSGPDESSSPASTISLVDECAMFQIDGSHDCHDDQVDAWSQCMNWLRARQTAPARTWSSFKVKNKTS